MGSDGVVCGGDEGVCLTERGGGEQAIAGDEMSEGKAPGGESMAAALV